MNIDLGTKTENYPSVSPIDEKTRRYYPSFTYSSDEEHELPDSGEMTVAFRKVRREESTDEDGKKKYSCTVEVRSIVGLEDEEVEEAPASNKGKATEDALDNLVKARMADKSKSKY